MVDFSKADACVEHARQLLASQLPEVEAAGFDFMPPFKDTTLQLYLLGVMWHFFEPFEPPVTSRDRSLVCLQSLLVADGMSQEEAKHRVAQLNAISRTSEGQDSQAIVAGYGALWSDGSLKQLFENFRHVPQVAGAPYRFFVRVKRVSMVSTLTAALLAAIAAWRMAPYDNGTIVIGAALGAAIVAGVASLAIGLALHRRMIAA